MTLSRYTSGQSQIHLPTPPRPRLTKLLLESVVRFSRGKIVPQILSRPPSKDQSTSSDLDVASQVPLSASSAAEKVIINLPGGGTRTFLTEYLRIWIKAQLEDGKYLTKIEASSEDVCGNLVRTQLTAEIWQNSLVRGPWKDNFLPTWTRFNEALISRLETINGLAAADSKFRQNSINFIRDLNFYEKNSKAQKRLDSNGHVLHIGKLYFSDEQAQKILATKTVTGTVESDLIELLETKGKTHDKVCASHDLSSKYAFALNIEWSNESQKAKALHEELGEMTLTSEGRGTTSEGKDTLRKFGKKG